MASLLRLGTRGSKLALVQTDLVRQALARAVPELAATDAIEVVTIKTTGDAIQDLASLARWCGHPPESGDDQRERQQGNEER